MPILRKLKSLLGVDDGEDDAERDVTVTVEHDPENEAAVKGADVEESSPTGDGDNTTVATASQADAVASESAAEESEDASDDADVESGGAAVDSGEDADETPDEVEIPDAEAPVDESAEESAEETAEESIDDAAEESADEPEVENAEEDYEVDAESDDSGASEPVDVLNGIGSAYADRLGNAGVATVADLADADAAELSEATDIAEGRIEGWIDQANEY